MCVRAFEKGGWRDIPESWCQSVVEKIKAREGKGREGKGSGEGEENDKDESITPPIENFWARVVVFFYFFPFWGGVVCSRPSPSFSIMVHIPVPSAVQKESLLVCASKAQTNKEVNTPTHIKQTLSPRRSLDC